MQQIALLVVVMALISNCGPVYKVEYSYTPPQTKQGRMCANQCIQLTRECRNNCTINRNRCIDQTNTSRAINNALDVMILEKDSEDHRREHYHYHYADRDRCYRDEEKCFARCEDDQRDCYINCGAKVSKHEYCTENCHS